MAEECLFCKILAGEVPSEEVYADDNYYAFRDINPAAPTHVLVIPRKHIPAVNDATDDHAELLGGLFVTAKRVAEQEGLANDGYRCVVNNGSAAGQEVPHLHMHVLGGRRLSWPPG